MRAGTRILVVEDDRYMAELIEMELEHRGFEVECAEDGPSGVETCHHFRPEVVVLDIMLPGLDGVGVLKKLRAEGSQVPVIMLTARNAPADKVHSLDLGADDYLTKPFHTEELVSRIRTILRRVEGSDVLRVGDLEIDRERIEVRRAGEQISLTAQEYRLLEFMALNEGRVFSRETLLSRVWEADSSVTSNAVEVYIGYLRKKIDLPDKPKLLHTIRGLGYVLKQG
jgi:DNA-binding response OmpR family regulator